MHVSGKCKRIIYPSLEFPVMLINIIMMIIRYEFTFMSKFLLWKFYGKVFSEKKK